MEGSSDDMLFATCAGESRVLVTLDLDFASTVRFDPSLSAGIAVLRVPRLPQRESIHACVRRLARQLASSEIGGRLWIVDAERVRQYEPPGDTPT